MTYAPRRDPRPGPPELGRVGQSARRRFPRPEPALRRLPRRRGAEPPRVGVAIGDRILDLARLRRAGLCSERPCASREAALRLASLNRADGAGPDAGRPCAAALEPAAQRRGHARRADASRLLVPMADVEMLLPAAIGDYTDFYASRPPRHQRRPHVPARQPAAAELQVRAHRLPRPRLVHRRSGTAVRRPQRPDPSRPTRRAPAFGPSSVLDYELEARLLRRPRQRSWASRSRSPRRREHIFGLCLVNDWSARDIQTWEYQPLGPFLAKSFATTISPWVVTLEALEPFRAPAFRAPGGRSRAAAVPLLARRSGAGRPRHRRSRSASAPRSMRDEKIGPRRLSRGNFRDMYWTPAQMVAHHASNGCNLRPGDLLGERHGLGPDQGVARLPAGADLARGGAGQAADGRDAPLPRGRRRGHLRRSLRARRFVGIGLGECRGTVHE